MLLYAKYTNTKRVSQGITSAQLTTAGNTRMMFIPVQHSDRSDYLQTLQNNDETKQYKKQSHNDLPSLEGKLCSLL